MHVVMAGDYPADPNNISGGAAAAVRYLTQAMQQYSDIKLDLITLGKRGTDKQTVQHGDITVHYLPASKRPSYFSTLANIHQIRQEMLQLKPDLIHAQVAGEYAEAAMGTGLPWVLTLHGIRSLEVDLWQDFTSKYYRGWFIKREEQRTLKQAKHVISISPYIQSTFNGQLKANVYDIENAIDDVFFQVPFKSNPKQILFVGRLIPRKGVHTLLKAFACLHQKLPDVKLHLAGEGSFSNEVRSYPDQLHDIVRESGLEDAVKFLGPLDRDSLLKAYENSGAFVLSAVQETAPMVIMEAMAAGKPVISTDAGGARYLVEHEKSGYITPINDEQALCDALYKALKDPDQLAAMGRRSREIAEQCFHANTVAARTRDVYYRVLDQTPPS